jgi:hypothetical protein
MDTIINMKSLILSAIITMSTFLAFAQKNKTKPTQLITIPMEPAHWEYDTAGVAFTLHKNVKSAHMKNGSPMFLKNQQFASGTIEYDVEIGRGFPGISFRTSADRKNADNFYLRYFGNTSPESRTTLQYAAVIDGMSIWDLSDEYQAGASLKIPGWNHVKIVVSGKQMTAYVNDMLRPSMIVPELEGGLSEGGIAFGGGEVMIANVRIKPDNSAGNDSTPYISTYNDTRYLRNWMVTPPQDFPYGKEIVHGLAYMGGTPVKPELPDSTIKWTAIKAEPRGIVNLTRIYGGVVNNKRRIAWLKTTIESDRVQEEILRIGFSDEMWIFINGQFLYADKNHFGTPGQKYPGGRCTIENASVKLPLVQGKNEILISLTNYFFGWGIIARLDDTDGIHFSR